MPSKKILIADTDVNLAKELSLFFSNKGFVVCEIVNSGESAVMVSKQEQPDILLIDLHLEGQIDGIQAAIQIRSTLQIPVVFMLSTFDNQLIDRAKEAVPFGLVNKPIHLDYLSVIVDMAQFIHEMDKERQQTKKMLSGEKERLAVTLKSIGDGVITTDNKGNITLLNQIAEKLTGWTNQEAFGKPLDHVFHIINEHTRKRCENPVEIVMKTKNIVGLANDTILVSKTGEERIIADSGAPIIDNQGDIIGVVLVFRDVTEKVLLENRLKQSQKLEAVGTLTGGIAHDFNNIIGIILGNSELAIDDIPEWNPAYFCVDQIRKASLRAKDVVRQLLSFSRKSPQRKNNIKLLSILNDSYKLLRAIIPVNIDIQIQKHIPEDADIIYADPTQIHQILINLGTNAYHAMNDSGGLLVISVEEILLSEESKHLFPDLPPGRYIKIVVKDTGKGIDPDIRDRIFEPYFTTKDVDQGAGLGLAIVHGIVTAHGGAITFQSQIGEGSSFNVFLPALEPETSSFKSEKEPLPGGAESILFIDDEKALVRLIEKSLSSLGYNIHVMTNPIHALDTFKASPKNFDLIITDMAMPEMTGEDLVKKILKIRPDIPIIICTGYSDYMSEAKAIQIGCKSFLLKPLERSQLANTIRNVLDSSQS